MAGNKTPLNNRASRQGAGHGELSADKVVVYGTLFCPYCMRARKLLKSKKVAYTEIRVDGDKKLRKEMERLSGRDSVPQIFVGKVHIGGYDDLAALNRKGELDTMLQKLKEHV